MEYFIKNETLLLNYLKIDFALGLTTAIIGIIYSDQFAVFFGLSGQFLLIISVITLIYGLVALSLVLQKNKSIFVLRMLINANWIWAFISIILFFLHYENATLLGCIFLVLQIIVVGGLAFLEGNQIQTIKR